MTNKPTEYYNYAIQVEWSDRNRIAIISTEGDMSREAVDLWHQVTLKTLCEWPKGEQGHLLFNMTGPKQRYTPYGVRSTRQIYKNVPPDIRGYIAVVMNDTLLLRMMNVLMQYEVSLIQGRAKQKFFVSYDEAHNWLRSKLD